MRTVPLGELGEIVSGSTPKTGVPEFWNGDIPWITPADLSQHDGIYFHGKLRKITRAGFKNCSTAMLPSGTILFSSRAPIGHCALTTFPLCTNQGFKNIIPNKRLDPLYGYFALKFVTPSIIAKGRGATFAEVTKEMMEEVQVPYCDLPEQQRIARLLEQAVRLWRARRYALELSDTFLPAVFLELFGDLRVNPYRFEVLELGDVCDVRDGTHDSPKFHRQGVPLVTSKNLVNGFVDLADVDLISEEDFAKINKRSKVDRGDILMPMIGTIGNPVLVENEPRYAIKNVALIKFIAGSPSAIYTREVLRGAYFEYLTSRNSRGGTQKFIALGDIRGFRVPIPPVPLQQKFTTLVERHERLRAGQREALRQAEHLFQSLLHQTFTVGI